MDALKKACAELGLEFREGQKTYRWFGRSVGDYPMPLGFTASDLGKCEHAVGLPGNGPRGDAYEVGICRYKPGTKKQVVKDGRTVTVDVSGQYCLQWDFWNGGYGLEAKVGKNAGLLAQEYAAQVATKELRKKGYHVTRQHDKQTGKLHLVAR